MQTVTLQFTAWLAAEKAAAAAERELHAAMVGFGSGTRGAPSQECIATTRALRAEARRLFDGAMREMKQAAESLHHRRIVVEE